MTQDACSQPGGYVADNNDCDDTRVNVNPGGTEVCDGFDNDCNLSVDDNLTPPANTLQQGVCSGSIQTCAGVGGWVDDYSGIATYEAGSEITCDTLDNDCDGVVDESLIITYYQDSDADTYGDASVSQDVCLQPPGYVTDNTDCDDTNQDINPGITEICDGIDNNCNAQIDEKRVCSTGFWNLVLPAILNPAGPSR